VGFRARLFLRSDAYKIQGRKADIINGNYFLLPNNIFDEDMKPRDFAVYSFLVSRKDSVNECWYSVEHIAEYCPQSITLA